MKKLISILLFLFTFLNSQNLNFEDRQDLISKIKQTILNEELISKSMENFIIENYSLPNSISDLNLGLSSLDTNYFNEYNIDTSNQKINIVYSLKPELTDNSLISLYKSDTFRERTLYLTLNNQNIVRVTLLDDLARHLYGVINYNGGNITNCSTSTKNICLVTSTNSIRVKNSSGTALYEYKIENYISGPMMITSNTSLHSQDEFSFIPDGVSLMDENGVRYVKVESGIVQLQ